jgi:hypothetical protein
MCAAEEGQRNMIYTLNDLLMKMGAPEAKEKGQMRWHYFDKTNDEIGGFAEVRLVNGGNGLIAEMKHLRRDYEDDAGEKRGDYTESFYLYAERTGTRYKVTKVAFDGEEYSHPQKSIIELGLSMFHARALDISILMVEQAFNRQDILRPVVDERFQFRSAPIDIRDSFKKEAWGIVVPFRPRQQARLAV